MRLNILATLLASSLAVAQQRPIGTFGRPGAPTTFGNMVNSGAPPAGRNFGSVRGMPPPAISHPRHNNVAIVPYPVIWGSPYLGFGYDSPPPAYYYEGNPYAYQTDPGYSPQSQPPVVIINQNYRPDTVTPVLRDYSNGPLPDATGMKVYEQPTHPYDNLPAGNSPGAQSGNAPTNNPNDDQPPTIYLIAMKDHTIFPTVAYWVEGDTLHYITTEGSHNRATLALVDRDFSKQLNDERHVEFKLPAPK